MRKANLKMDRRRFLHTAAMVTATPATMLPVVHDREGPGKSCDHKSLDDMPLGVITGADDPEEDLKVVRDMSFSTCQLSIADYSPRLAKRLAETMTRYQISPNTLICMGPGEYVWNFIDGPSTVGLVPRKYRAERVKRLEQGINFCKAAGVPAVHAHFGFIPENPKDVLYTEFVNTMKAVGEYALKRGVDIYFETGQETPITLRRVIEDIGAGNLFVNYDTANLAMYGKSNPYDGLQILYNYIRSFHAKDGTYPTDPKLLGKEAPIPEGVVDFPAIISFLKQKNFKGAFIIESELTGQKHDYIMKTKEYLERLIQYS